MAVKNLSTRVAIIGRGAKCRGGSSAVDKSAYISRTTMYSEYDGTSVNMIRSMKRSLENTTVIVQN